MAITFNPVDSLSTPENPLVVPSILEHCLKKDSRQKIQQLAR